MAEMLVTMHERLLGKSAEVKVREISLIAAIIGFILHLVMWLAYQLNILEVGSASADLLDSPLDALYTPFRFYLRMKYTNWLEQFLNHSQPQ